MQDLIGILNVVFVAAFVVLCCSSGLSWARGKFVAYTFAITILIDSAFTALKYLLG